MSKRKGFIAEFMGIALLICFIGYMLFLASFAIKATNLTCDLQKFTNLNRIELNEPLTRLTCNPVYQSESMLHLLYDSLTLKIFKDDYRINEIPLEEYTKSLNKEDLKDVKQALEMRKIYGN